MIKKTVWIIAVFVFWILIAALSALLFLGILWLTNGGWFGLPAYLVVIFLFYFLLKYLYKKHSENHITTSGAILRVFPTLIAFILICWSMIPAASTTLADLPETEGLKYWDLGSERVVAVMHHQPPEPITQKEEAILFIHGGPGAYIRDFDRDFFASFTEDGYEVYLYEQIGAGRSAILDVEEYSHEDNVDDLAKVIQLIEQPLILIGQSYGAGLISSYLHSTSQHNNISAVILTEPGPLPGKYPQQGSYFDDKTTLAENHEGPGIFEMFRSPRFPIALVLPPENRFMKQVEIINYLKPELHHKIVSTSFCKDDPAQQPYFTPLRVNIKAGMAVRNSFMKAETPDLRDLDLPVLLILGECSYLPRGFAIDYFDSYTINRSHWIPGVGHITWGNPQGADLTREAILSFLDDSEMPLPNEPDLQSRFQFVESGK